MSVGRLRRASRGGGPCRVPLDQVSEVPSFEDDAGARPRSVYLYGSEAQALDLQIGQLVDARHETIARTRAALDQKAPSWRCKREWHRLHPRDASRRANEVAPPRRRAPPL